MCHPPGDSDSESVTIAFWLHLPTQRYIGCHGFTKSLQTQMTQTHIPSFTDFFLMKTQEWKDCYAYRNIGIRGSNAKYETGMKELKMMLCTMLRSIQTFSVNGKFTELYHIFCARIELLFTIFICSRYRPWATIRLLHHFGFVMCVNSRLYCTHFSCRWHKIHVSCWLTQISKRQCDPWLTKTLDNSFRIQGCDLDFDLNDGNPNFLHYSVSQP